MIPWIHLDTGLVPGGGELKLAQRGKEFSIRLGQIELMNSRLSGSEEALATLVLDRLKDRQRPRLLIGGLGMGFTLRAALAAAPASAEIIVAELVPSVIAWARGPMAELFGDSLLDPRVSIVTADVGDIMRRGAHQFDGILLDVDNGPEALTRPANDALYAAAGLGNARSALKTGGILAVWSQGPDERFTKALQRSRFLVEETRIRANKGRSGARHVIWLAERIG
jgi:spermidine synthase